MQEAEVAGPRAAPHCGLHSGAAGSPGQNRLRPEQLGTKPETT